jgi:UDP-N-acetyl-D-mannosaminuronic acid transferase (WecB/TagA/CpsF family)
VAVSEAVTGSGQFRKILGIRFFVGNAEEAVARIRDGGLLVVPAAPALKNLEDDPGYREALQAADVVIADSAFMVMIWNRLQHDSIRRVSGLKYLSSLIKQPEFREPGGSFWIMASERSARRNTSWLRRQGIHLGPADRYVAPMYGNVIEDPELLRRIEERRPRHIVVTLGGGVQERLGLYLRSGLSMKPAIHCVGAAIAFLSGDQVQIPWWADRMYLGWLFRCISDPPRYMPRYWDARKLLSLMRRYGSALPGAPATAEERANSECVAAGTGSAEAVPKARLRIAQDVSPG